MFYNDAEIASIVERASGFLRTIYSAVKNGAKNTTFIYSYDICYSLDLLAGTTKAYPVLKLLYV